MLKKIFESTLIMGSSSLIVMAIDVARIKTLAVFLGPAGVGTLSLLNSYHVFILSIVGLGLGTGIAKYVSVYSRQGDVFSVQKTVGNAFQMVGLFACIVFLFSLSFSPQLSESILQDRGSYSFIICYAVTFPLAVFPLIAGSALQGMKRVAALAKINVIRSIAAIALVIPMVYLFRLPGAVYSVVLTTLLHLILSAVYFKRETGVFKIFFWAPLDRNILRKLFQYGLTSLLVAVAYYFTQLLLRMLIVNKLGLEMNGIYQPVWALTTAYLTLVLSSMSTYSYPRLCELSDLSKIRAELNGALRIAIIIIVPVMFFLLIARGAAIQVLYSSEFLQASDYMPVQIIGDFFKILCWSIGLYLLPSKRLATFIWLNLLQDALLLSLSVILIGPFKLHGIAAAFLISYFLCFFAYYICAVRQISFRLWPINRTLLWASFAAILWIIFSEQCFPLAAHCISVIVTFAVWTGLSVQRKEALQLKAYLFEKIGKCQPT